MEFSKKVGISAIRAMSANLTTVELADFRGFSGFLSLFRVKIIYFTFAKNRVLKPRSEPFTNSVPRRESAPGARETRGRWARDSHRGQRDFFVSARGKLREAPASAGRTDGLMPDR